VSVVSPLRAAAGEKRRLLAAIRACAVIGILAAGRVMFVYWWQTGNVFLRAKSGIWVALAWDFAHH